MFAHHILKPARTPLENSVWGTDRSSGTFSTLFQSRLLRAQEYLRSPFEIRATAAGGKLSSEKVFSKRAVKPLIVDDFDALMRNENAALLLNGDSASLPIPAGSVDAVVTDPPYFDYVHYSELSDFFFAWLSLAVRKDAHYFRRPDSSHEGEVQDRDPATFATKIGRVFAECLRVLKPDGIMAFTFHHSAPEGWLAIHQALAGAGFIISAAHPIKAEMSVGSPKSAAKQPINLDAILVCRKRDVRRHTTAGGSSPSRVEVAAAKDSARLKGRFKLIGRELSRGDSFVIEASQLLRHASAAGFGETQVRALLDSVHERCHSEDQNTPARQLVLPVVHSRRA
jgi:putative DNA methylase